MLMCFQTPVPLKINAARNICRKDRDELQPADERTSMESQKV